MLAGFEDFNGVTAGQSLSPLTVGFETDQLGFFDESITLNPRSQNAGGFDGALAPVTLTVRGTVVPEPSTLALVALAAQRSPNFPSRLVKQSAFRGYVSASVFVSDFDRIPIIGLRSVGRYFPLRDRSPHRRVAVAAVVLDTHGFQCESHVSARDGLRQRDTFPCWKVGTKGRIGKVQFVALPV
ncbi:MAG: hypothetical protein ABI680_18215 [Chthoniobacteraceae bacterium]